MDRAQKILLGVFGTLVAVTGIAWLVSLQTGNVRVTTVAWIGTAFITLLCIWVVPHFVLIWIVALFPVRQPDNRGSLVELRSGKQISKADRELTRKMVNEKFQWRILKRVGRDFLIMLAITVVCTLASSFLPTPYNRALSWTCLGIVMIAFYFFLQKTYLRFECAALLCTRHCGGCGYDLRQLPAEDDGCTVCPECGAAWRLFKQGAEEKRSSEVDAVSPGD